MENQNELIRAIIDKKIKESLLAQQEKSNANIMDRLNNIGSKTNNVAEGLSNVGNYLNNNTTLNGIGTKAQTLGNTLKSGASAIQNAIPSLFSNSAAVSGATGATTGAASGAAMSNPIGAIVALGAMALNGTNRKRAKQAGQQAEQLANNAIEQNRANLPTIENNINNLAPTVNNPQNNLNTIDNSAKPTLKPYENIIPQSTEDLKKIAFHNLANGFDDFLAGYNENKNHSFDWNNLKSDDSKGIMQRLGEGAGTVARIAQNPVAQGVIAGGLSGLLSGDPLYGLSSAYKYANSKYKANLFKDILEQQGVNIGNNNGIIDASDLAKILVSRKAQKDYMTRSEYDLFRLDNGQITADEYNTIISNPDYNGDEVLNIGGLESVAKAGKYAQENKESRSKNYWRNQNEGKNIMRVEYDERPDSHNYTHVIYDNGKPETKNTTYVKYENKPQYTPPKTITKPQPRKPQPSNNSNSERVRVQSPDGKVGTIPKNQLIEALKNGFKKLK